MGRSILRPIKYTEPKNVTKKFRQPSFKPKKPASDYDRCHGNNTADVPRIVRVFVTDPDATDSSSDEEADFFGRQRMKRQVSEIMIEASCKNTATTSTISYCNRKRTAAAATDVTTACGRPLKLSSSNGNGRKLRGVRRRQSGKWVAEIRDPARRRRLWLGTYDTAEEAAMAYNKAAIELRRPDALTNFVTPPAREIYEKPGNITVASVSGYELGGESSRKLSSPTSALNFRTQSSEEIAVELEKPVQELQKEESKPIQKQLVPLECQGKIETNISNDSGVYLSPDLPSLEDFFNFSIAEPFFDDGATILQENNVFSDDFNSKLLDTPKDFGCSSLLRQDNCFEDIGDLFL